MKTITFSSLLIFMLICVSCGRKQEEIKFHKNTAKDSALNVSELADSVIRKNTPAGEDMVRISSSETSSHVNEAAIVSGYVADVVEREKVAYLNFDKKYPKNTFTAVIFSEKFSEVGDLSVYKNQNVEIQGTITEYRWKPQIIITSKNQINIVK